MCRGFFWFFRELCGGFKEQKTISSLSQGNIQLYLTSEGAMLHGFEGEIVC